MLTVDNLSVVKGKNKILSDIHCEFAPGVHGLLGANGAGKTTLLRCLLGLYPNAMGQILYDGNSISDVMVGYLPQKFGLFPNMTVREALIYLGTMMKISKKQMNDQVEQCLEDVNLTDKMDSKMAALSGGMVRRVGIAQAFMGNPELIILDEPTAGLDPEERLRFKNLIKTKQDTATIIISTHIVDDIDYLSDYVTVIDDGKILMQDTCDAIRGLAQGKVAGIPQEELELLAQPYFLVKEYEKEGTKHYRVLLKDAPNGECLNPTLEDGYLCVLKKI